MTEELESRLGFAIMWMGSRAATCRSLVIPDRYICRYIRSPRPGVFAFGHRTQTVGRQGCCLGHEARSRYAIGVPTQAAGLAATPIRSAFVRPQ